MGKSKRFRQAGTMTKAEAVDWLVKKGVKGVSATKLQRWSRMAEGPQVRRVSGVLVYTEEDLVAWDGGKGVVNRPEVAAKDAAALPSPAISKPIGPCSDANRLAQAVEDLVEAYASAEHDKTSTISVQELTLGGEHNMNATNMLLGISQELEIWRDERDKGYANCLSARAFKQQAVLALIGRPGWGDKEPSQLLDEADALWLLFR